MSTTQCVGNSHSCSLLTQMCQRDIFQLNAIRLLICPLPSAETPKTTKIHHFYLHCHKLSKLNFPNWNGSIQILEFCLWHKAHQTVLLWPAFCSHPYLVMRISNSLDAFGLCVCVSVQLCACVNTAITSP